VKYYLPKIGDITLASVLSYSFQEFLYNKIAAGMNVIWRDICSLRLGFSSDFSEDGLSVEQLGFGFGLI